MLDWHVQQATKEEVTNEVDPDQEAEGYHTTATLCRGGPHRRSPMGSMQQRHGKRGDMGGHPATCPRCCKKEAARGDSLVEVFGQVLGYRGRTYRGGGLTLCPDIPNHPQEGGTGLKTFANSTPRNKLRPFRITAQRRNEGSISRLALIRTGYSREEITKAFEKEFQGFYILEIKEENV